MKILVFVLFTALPVLAEDWITSDGKTYQNVKIVKIEADCVTILDSNGGARVELSKLPPDIQKKLGYDPSKAASAADQRLLSDKAAIASIQSANAQKQNILSLQKTARSFPVQVIQVLPTGLLCEKQSGDYEAKYNPNGDQIASVYTLSGTGIMIFLETSPNGHTDGESFSPFAAQSGTYSYTDTKNSIRTIEKWIIVSKPDSP